MLGKAVRMRMVDLFLCVALSATAGGCRRVASGTDEELPGGTDPLDAGPDADGEPNHGTDIPTASQDPFCNQEDLDGDALIESRDDVFRYAGYTSVHNLEIHDNNADLSTLRCLEHVRGDLSITEYEGETLDGLRNLRYVDGNVRITRSDTFRQLSLPGLVSIAGSLTIDDHDLLEKVSLPRVETIGEGIDATVAPGEDDVCSIVIHGNFQLVEVDFSALRRAPLGIYLVDLIHTENLSFATLTETRVLLLYNVDMESLDGFALLERVDRLEIVFSRIGSLNLPGTLSHVGGLELGYTFEIDALSLPASLAVGAVNVHDNIDLEEVAIFTSTISSLEIEENERLTALNAGALRSATAVRIEQNEQLDTVDLSGLTEAVSSVAGGLALIAVNNNPSLTQLLLAGLTVVNGNVSIMENDLLPVLETASLEQVDGEMRVARNLTLLALKLDSLGVVGGNFWVMDNSQLACDMRTLLDTTEVGGDVFFCGNDESGTCGELDCRDLGK